MKTIITVIGKDRPGIVSGISSVLFKLNINILDISQTIMNEYFTMTMVADCSNISSSFDDAKKELIDEGEALCVKVTMQRQEIFDAMHHL